MKTLILIIGIALLSISIQAQMIEAKSLDTLSVKYIQVLCLEKAMGNNVNIIIDYGAEKVVSIVENGKPVVFNSAIHALNYVCEHGYEFVFFVPGVNAVAGQRYLLKNLHYK